MNVHPNGEPFPSELLVECESALLLFGSAYLGANDGAHVRRAGLRDVTVVDHDQDTLTEMARRYPPEWAFVRADCFAFATTPGLARWDIVVADLPSSCIVEMTHAVGLWARLANRYVVTTMVRHNFVGVPSLDELDEPPPDGWYRRGLLLRTPRRGGIYWLVMERL